MVSSGLTSSSHANASAARWALATALTSTFVLALVVGGTGAMRAAPPWVIPLYVAGVNVALAAAYRAREDVRAAVEGLSWRTLVAPHALRAPIGVGFLVMMTQGVMPPSLAWHAGLGDIVAGVWAAALVLRAKAPSPRALRAWNLFGLVDIVTVVLGFQRVLLIEHHPQLAERFPSLPFPLLPFFVVPWVIATHLAIVARRSRAEA